jgi:uncharacterized phiE125 gp8 family phage protein
MPAIVLVTPATENVIDLEEAKAHLNYGNDTDADDEIEQAIVGAQSYAETECGRAFLASTWLYVLDCFPKCGEPIRLPLGRTASVTSVKYYDTDGVLQTMDAGTYHAALRGEPARIVLKANEVWPALELGRPEAVEITYVAGWDTPDDVPGSLKDAVKLILGDRWQFRGDVAKAKSIPDAACRILTAYRAHEVA